MTTCPYCAQEAIVVTSPTTGCCNRARLHWITKTYAKELVESKDWAGNATALDNLHAQITAFIDHTTDRDALKQQIEACWNAIPFAINGSATLAEHIADLGKTVRTVIEQRDHAMRMFDLQKKIADILECHTDHDQTCSGGSMCSCGFKDMRNKLQPFESLLGELYEGDMKKFSKEQAAVTLAERWQRISENTMPPCFYRGMDSFPYVMLVNINKPDDLPVMGYLTEYEGKRFWSPRPWPVDAFTHWRHIIRP